MKLMLSSIHKRFGGVKALDGCSISVKEKMITAVIGPNGSGKTTLFNVISGLTPADQGSIRLNGKDVNHLEDFERAKYISRTFQDVRLFRHLTLGEHIAIALSSDDEQLLRNFILPAKEDADTVKKALKIVFLDKPPSTHASDLSYGQRKLLDLAVAIAKPHTLLMLDEPVAGVTPSIRKEISAILKGLRKKEETVLLIEHDMNFVMGLADYIFVLDEGKVIAEGKPKEIQSNKKVLEAYLGD